MTINYGGEPQPDTSISRNVSNGGTEPMPQSLSQLPFEFLDRTG